MIMNTEKVDNYARFYSLLNRMVTSNREELKRQIVTQYTFGRTDSLREMNKSEYYSACAGMEKILLPGQKRNLMCEELRRRRSSVLHQLQLLGINTSDWDRVNTYCSDPRIAGKVFRELDCEELDTLLVKLRAIRRK